jgi:hypothetical protein
MEQPLRQSRTFWQWLTHQEGTLFIPERSWPALEAIKESIEYLHDEMEDLRCDEYVDNNSSYHKLVDALSKLHDELIRRSKEESSANSLNSATG